MRTSHVNAHMQSISLSLALCVYGGVTCLSSMLLNLALFSRVAQPLCFLKNLKDISPEALALVGRWEPGDGACFLGPNRWNCWRSAAAASTRWGGWSTSWRRKRRTSPALWTWTALKPRRPVSECRSGQGRGVEGSEARCCTRVSLTSIYTFPSWELVSVSQWSPVAEREVKCIRVPSTSVHCPYWP